MRFKSRCSATFWKKTVGLNSYCLYCLPKFALMTTFFNRLCRPIPWAVPDKLCPPPIEDVSAKSQEFYLLFFKSFLEILSEKTKKCGFWVSVEFFFWKSVWKYGFFVQKTWKSKPPIFYQKKSGNPTSSMGEGKFFWNSPMPFAIWSYLVCRL